jgi:peptidoglycan/LPS O-acetylase OafA/YrhL
VLLVVASHVSPLGSIWRFLGYGGVTVFFTLSGFLITSMLVEERDSSGRVDLRRFYVRRTRRLVPALVTMVAVVTVVLAAAGSWDWLTLAALSYSANWVLALGHGVGSPMGHTWSLSIEEQFYVLWPVVLIGLSRSGRRTVRGVLVALCLTTALVPLALAGGPEARVYYGSDARAFPILAGCLLAVVLSGRTETRSRPWAAAVAVAAIVAVCHVPAGGFERLVAPQCVAMLTAATIFWTAQGAGAPWLELGWLRWFGHRSYGLYLWSYPVFVGLEHLGAGVWVVALAGVPTALLLTELSWRLVEQPFRSRRPMRSDALDRRQPVAAGALLSPRG